MILNCSPGPMFIPYKRRGSLSEHSDDYPSFASDSHCRLSKGKEPALKTVEDAAQVLLSEPGNSATTDRQCQSKNMHTAAGIQV